MVRTFLIISMLLWIPLLLVNPILGEEDSIFNNSSHHFSMTYPSSWIIQFNDHDNIGSTSQNTMSLAPDSNILEINSILQQNVSLFKYVIFEINKKIDNYAVGLFSSFSIQNITQIAHVPDNPIFCVEYFVIMSNDEMQTPNSILNCYIRNNINNEILELHFVQYGYGIDPKNKFIINRVLESISFK